MDVCIPLKDLKKTGFTQEHASVTADFLERQGKAQFKELFDPEILMERWGVEFVDVRAIDFQDIEKERLPGSQDFRTGNNEDQSKIAADIERDGFDLCLLPPAVFIEEDGGVKYYYINGRTRKAILTGYNVKSCIFLTFRIVNKNASWRVFGSPWNNTGRRSSGLASVKDNKKIIMNNLEDVFRLGGRDYNEYGKSSDINYHNWNSDIHHGIRIFAREQMCWAGCTAKIEREIIQDIEKQIGAVSHVVFSNGENEVLEYTRENINMEHPDDVELHSTTLEFTQLMKKLSPEKLSKSNKMHHVVVYNADYGAFPEKKFNTALKFWRQLRAYENTWGVKLPSNVKILGIIPQLREKRDWFPMDTLITREKAEEYLSFVGD